MNSAQKVEIYSSRHMAKVTAMKNTNFNLPSEGHRYFCVDICGLLFARQ